MSTYDSICIKSAETDEELCGRGYVHCTAWQEAYRGIVCDQYLDSMTVEATTARARQFPENTLVAKDKEKVVGFAVYGPSRDKDLPNAGEVMAIYVLSEYYDKKIGYRLMNEAVSRLSEYDTIFVWVLEKNERAIRFYHKYGFEFDGCKMEWNLGTTVSLVRMIKVNGDGSH
ncbi:Acetyltransferase (GNAT) family protein [Lachnospiraceae bacterium XPB1003]|nr:Acetyltransferase (GNAT) family protein [Lachnospiraceae bacterium XPB1003]